MDFNDDEDDYPRTCADARRFDVRRFDPDLRHMDDHGFAYEDNAMTNTTNVLEFPVVLLIILKHPRCWQLLQNFAQRDRVASALELQMMQRDDVPSMVEHVQQYNPKLVKLKVAHSQLGDEMQKLKREFGTEIKKVKA